MENQKKSFTSPSKLKAAIVYVLMIFIGTTFLSILFGMIVASIKGVDASTVANSFWSKDPIPSDIKECMLIGQGYGNFLGYFIAFGAVLLWMRDDFIIDFRQIKEDKKFYGVIIPAFMIGFAGIAILIDYLFGLIVSSSENQNTIVELLKSDGRIPMIISTVIFAPIIEEMIYRKAIFSVTQSYNLPLTYVMSIMLFALPHMLSTSANIGTWFLQLIPYVLCGGLLCMIYHLSGYNVYASIAAHMLNNILAVLFVFI